VAPIRRFLLRLLTFFRADRAEAELAREIHSHLQLLEDKFLAEGMSPDEARSAARRAFGGVEQVKEHQRDTRSFRWLDGCWLDIKLGARLLVKYPGLTLVGGLAIAFGIAVGACVFELVTQVFHPTLPLEEGDRIVGIRNWDAAAASVEGQALHDFAVWKEGLESVEDLGAFRTLERNLVLGSERAEPVAVAEISASAFRVARIRPLLGRPLFEADEQAGAPAVVVIGYDVWRKRFGGDPKVVGRTVRLGSAQSTVVGVMPEGFAFPVAHSFWIPFRLKPLEYERRQGPGIQVFGRLAPGVTLDQAQAELAALGSRAAAAFPDTHKHLRPEVLPYAESVFPIRMDGTLRVAMYSINLFFVMFLALICANVATLVFARTATRESEIVVRNALGASRGRIVMQLFAEALVLGGVAALAGLAAAGFGLKKGIVLLENGLLDPVRGGGLPFWMNAELSPKTLVYAGVLTVFGAVISGALPALKVTRGMQARLRQAAVGGSGLRFGRVWTGLIVLQVAVTVAFPAAAWFVRRDAVQIQSLDVGFQEREYLSVRLEMDREASQAEFRARFRTTNQELERRLMAEPGVDGVTFANLLPRMDHPQRRIEMDEGMVAPPQSALAHSVSSALVDVDFFDVLGAPVLSGRGFHSGDLVAGQGVVIVNQSFVRQVLGGGNPVGRRVRYLDPEDPDAVRSPEEKPGPWYEIVGVVKDLGMTDGSFPGEGAGIYHPIALDGAYPVHMAVHVGPGPESFAPRLRGIATAVDPTLRLYELQPLDEMASVELKTIGFWFRVVVLASAVALLLSLAGIYSIMSFTVSRRTREIGIRSALGADPQCIVAAIFSRAFAQFGLGVAAGGGLVLALIHMASGGWLSARGTGLFVAYMFLMMGVCTLACIVPTRRALRVQPTEAMRADR
jgi:putative ABC transport system permease protein